jgi:hypothetical protein
VKAGQEPAPPDCGGGVLAGGDTGQSVPATAGGPSTVTSSGGGRERIVVGAAGSWRIAPCWVLKEQPGPPHRTVWGRRLRAEPGDGLFFRCQA